MARRMSVLLRAAQKCFSSTAIVASNLSSYAKRNFTEGRLLIPAASRLVPLTCYRFQHSHSADSDDSDSNEVSREHHPRRKKYEAMLQPVIEMGETLSTAEWMQLKEEVLNEDQFVNEDNIDAIIMGQCIRARKFHMGSSFLDALKDSNVVPNIATLSRFLKLCYECCAGDEEMLLGICDEIRRRCPVMDSTTAENVIHGLACTSRWQEGFELLSEIRLTSVPTASSFNVLAKAAFDNGELSKGWEIMEQMLQVDRRPFPPVYKAWIDQCMRAQGSDASVMIGQLLDFWADNDLRPSLDVAEHLRNWFEKDSYAWEGTFSSLTPRGSCENCRTILRKKKVTEMEFEAMRKQFFEQVLVGNNVFLKTNPEELETFQQYLSRTAPYDVVVDGLNVAYSRGNLRPQQAARVLASVVQHFAVRSRRVLVLGRRHMQNWPQREMNSIHEHASVFLAQDVSQDDPFLLYATMYSGQYTQFVSRDLMRGHVYLLKDRMLRRVFRRWQQQRQLQVLRVGMGEVTIKPPLSYNPSVQQGPGAVWHIPYDLEFSLHPKQLYEPPRHWLCLMKTEDI